MMADKNLMHASIMPIAAKPSQYGIDPALVAPRRELSSIIQAAENRTGNQHPLMNGWRAELLGETFRNLIKSNFRE